MDPSQTAPPRAAIGHLAATRSPYDEEVAVMVLWLMMFILQLGTRPIPQTQESVPTSTSMAPAPKGARC